MSHALDLDLAHIREQLLQEDFLILCIVTHPRGGLSLWT